MNRLLFGDNLKWLRDRNIFPDAHPDSMSGQAVDLVYLDPPAWPKLHPEGFRGKLRRGEGPPFNSNANYNVLFKGAERQGQPRDDLVSFRDPQGGANGGERSQPSGEASQAQFHAFTDTWEWTADVDATYAEFVDNCLPQCGTSVVELVEALKKFLKTSPMIAYIRGLKATGRNREIPRWLIVSDFTRIALHKIETKSLAAT